MSRKRPADVRAIRVAFNALSEAVAADQFAKADRLFTKAPPVLRGVASMLSFRAGLSKARGRQ
jgi:hypothetical protein